MEIISRYSTSQIIDLPHRFPKSSVTANQEEFDRVKLNIVCGTLPDDLQGHIFIVAPGGSVDSEGLPYPNGDALLNGDGMVFRLDFDRKGEISFKNRIVKPPDYYADKATQENDYSKKYRFGNHGIARYSFTLGLRNQLNTAFLPMKFAQDSEERLLITYDAGRPYEIDTEILELVTPVGSNQELRGQLDRLKFPLAAFKFPFKSILSTGHPAFDYSEEGQLVTVNYGRSIGNLAKSIRLIHEIEGFLTKTKITSFLKSSKNLVQRSKNWVEEKIGVELEDFTYLVCWDGASEIQRWKLVLPDGLPVKIEQTIHQMGISKDYVVIMDTAYTAGFPQLTNGNFTRNKKIDALLKALMERPACPDSSIYIIRRTDLKTTKYSASNKQIPEVLARKVVIPLQAAHFLVEYDNPQGNITLHVAHICAMQVSAWISQYDVFADNLDESVPSYVRGVEHNETDISRMGRYTIHGETGKALESKIIAALRRTWGVDLFTYLDRISTGKTVGQLENIYWSSFGLWPELMTKFIYDLYKDYKYQQIPREQILNLAKKGISPCLFRLHTKSMEIADRYQFPKGYMMLSPQFVPRSDSTSSTHGYIICAVYFGDRNEVWIFDANHLAQGPLCQLHHPSLQLGFTLHTAWLREITKHKANYKIPVKKDYQTLVEKNNRDIQKLFEEEIYPHFE